MRMWMTDPKIMCRQHLLGEHVELHMFVGTINHGIKVDGYIRNNLLEIKSIISRHEELVKEMKKRGMNHQSPLPSFNQSKLPKMFVDYTINKESALNDLLGRCKLCKESKRNG